MTYGMLRKRVLSLLNIDPSASPTEGSLLAACDALFAQTVASTVRRAALCLRFCLRDVSLSFTSGDGGVWAHLPKDFLAVKSLFAGGRRYSAPHMEAAGGRLYLLTGGVTAGTLTYYACPEAAFGEADAPLPFDDGVADTVAYGTAAELCHALFPTDMRLYMRLMTEFDERMTKGAPRLDEEGIANRLFGRRGGRL